ncbi:tRNA pseudouridine(38-40) synthase TruA [Dermatobacter hominis]|uniref:tRNA pseudouridine(38-40) synthase TruA n=1 Tax=Dermatobacter hominis TaxID=2884263 RepID=UPI001D120CFA|nr:tRNA pseudouridine(38-40) synthase TruA [Dermatobacter hominis]UDY33858.1 tRNA pseudouridine(38-40) synthase TruA [Dermatobacter hominis]
MRTQGEGSTVRLRLDVAYDGSGFHGFAENRGVATVGGSLRDALERVLQVPVELTCAGRTDAGVHARGQVVSLDVPVAALDAVGERARARAGSRLHGGAPDLRAAALVRLRDSLNGLLGPAIVVGAASSVDDGFDARFSATSRTYRYLVLNREVPDPFLAPTSWWVDQPLDLDRMQAACAHLLGEHDFSCFCRRPRPADPDADPVSLVRRVLAAGWTADDPDGRGLLRFEITASAFCHQMVRSIVGMLVDVGRGRRAPDDVRAAIGSLDRARAGQLAPPRGLVLWEVGY